MTRMQREPTPHLIWPRPEVQAEWALLSRCLNDTAYLSSQYSDKQVRALEVAIAHGVGPLLYHRLKASEGLNGLVDHVAERFQGIYLRTAASNLLLSSQIPSIVQGFEEAQIPVLFVKGIVLAETVYNNLALRSPGDLDLIVRAEDVNRAMQIVRKLGYERITPVSGDFNPEINHARFCQRIDNRGFPLHLHHALVKDALGGSPEVSTWFWPHTASGSINGCSVTTLKAEANVIYLCTHLASHHGWEPRFISLYDIHLLLKASQANFDWGLFTQLVETLQCEPYVYYVLSAARTFLNTPVPETVLAELGRTDHKSLVLNWQMKLSSTRAIRTLADWSRTPGYPNRFHFLLHTVFPTRAYMIDRYRPSNHRLWPLLYPYRWSIMFRDVIQTLGMLWRRRGI